MNILSVFGELLAQSGFAALTWQQAVMLLISFILLYLAIKKQFEPLLLLPDCLRYVPRKSAAGRPDE